MPKTIPCWGCKGKGRIREDDSRGFREYGCPTCKGGGVLSVYTQAELKEAIKKEREACALICDKIDLDNVKDYIRTDGHHYYRGKSQGALNCAEAIRGRE